MAPLTQLRNVWQRILSKSCFGSTPSTQHYALLDEEEEIIPIMTEQVRFRDTSLLPISRPPLSFTPPPTMALSPYSDYPPSAPTIRSTPLPKHRLHRRALLTTSTLHAPELPPPTTHPSESPRLKNGMTITETELTDNMNLVDTANMIGASASVVGMGYAAAQYYGARRVERETRRKEEDLEAGSRVESEHTSVTEVSAVQEAAKSVEPGPPPSGENLIWTGMR